MPDFMKNISIISIYFFFSLILLSCRKEPAWQPLFNGKDLGNWDKHIGTPLKGKDSLFKLATPENVFSVVEKNGEKLIRISGTVNGSLATRQSFGNYHLKLVFRWGDSVWATRNSGLLYHSFGDFGAAMGTWMSCIECQLMHDNLGDTYLMNNTVCETAALKNDSTGQFLFNPSASGVQFGKGFTGQSVKKRSNAEKPLGEWNTVELYSLGKTTVHVVNGVTIMVNHMTGYSENDIRKPLTSGKIQLQSEGAELFIKTIEICPIERIPEGILK
jgi:hypothetical protein